MLVVVHENCDVLFLEATDLLDFEMNQSHYEKINLLLSLRRRTHLNNVFHNVFEHKKCAPSIRERTRLVHHKNLL